MCECVCVCVGVYLCVCARACEHAHDNDANDYLGKHSHLSAPAKTFHVAPHCQNSASNPPPVLPSPLPSSSLGSLRLLPARPQSAFGHCWRHIWSSTCLLLLRHVTLQFPVLHFCRLYSNPNVQINVYGDTVGRRLDANAQSTMTVISVRTMTLQKRN